MQACRPVVAPRRRRSLRTIRSIVALAATLPAHASAAEELRLDTVEVSAELEGAPPPEPTVAEEPTGFGTVIEIDERAGRRMDLGELLLEAPGTRIHHAPGASTLSLRGGSADQSLVLLDGIPLNAAAGGGVDLRTIPAGLLERITLLRGNEGARYGAGALGGVALLETRNLRDETGGALSLSAGSFGTFGLDASVWGGGRTASGLVALTLHRSDGDWVGPYDPTPQYDSGDIVEQRIGNNDSKAAGALLKGRVSLGESTELHALLHGFLGERGLPGTFYTRDDHRRDERRLLAALRIEGEPAGDLRLFGGAELRHDEMAVWSDSPVRDVGSQPATTEPGKPWQIENALAVRTGAEAAPVEWTLLRAEAEVGSEWLDSPYHAERSRERLALSLADELYLGSAITVAPALRWDRIGGLTGLSPRIGAAWRPLELLEVRANWGRTFRVPSLGELYLEQGRVKANPDLDPERGWTTEAGVVLRFPLAQLQATAFYSRTDDLILYEVTSGVVSKPFNFHDAEMSGGEIEAVVQPLRWLTLRGNYDLTRTRNLRDDPRYWGKELPYRPAHRALLHATVRHEDYEAFAGASHQSEQYANRKNTVSLPAYTSVIAGAGVRLVERPWTLWLSAQVDNAFDAHRLDHFGFPQPGRAFTVTLRAHAPEAPGATLPEKS